MSGKPMAEWLKYWPACPPIRYLLREKYPRRWLRVHSLPGGKRIPDGSRDENVLLRRHLRVVSEIMTDTTKCYLILHFAGSYRGEQEPTSIRALQPRIVAKGLARWKDSDRDGDELGVIAISEITYEDATCRALILDVAYDRTAPLLFFKPADGRIYSPYDGGADLFFETARARDAAARRFKNWMSARIDTL